MLRLSEPAGGYHPCANYRERGVFTGFHISEELSREISDCLWSDNTHAKALGPSTKGGEPARSNRVRQFTS